MMDASRDIDNVEVTVRPYPAGTGYPTDRSTLRIELDDGQDVDSEVYGILNITDREEAAWLVAHITAAFELVWPPAHDPDTPTQAALIASLVSSGRDAELVALRDRTASLRAALDAANERERECRRAADAMARAAEAVVTLDTGDEARILAYYVTRYAAHVNAGEVARLRRDYLKAADSDTSE